MSDDEDHFGISRRMLCGGLAAALSVGYGATGCTAVAPRPIEAQTPLQQMRLLMKMMASVGQAAVPWFYTGRIYAVRSAAAPVHLYNFEGSEVYWIRPDGPERWSMAVSTLTFYRDRTSGVYLDNFDNPLTGKAVAVTANVLRSKPGESAIYTPQSMTAMGETQPVTMEIHRNGEVLWLTTSRANHQGFQPSMEVNTLFSSTADIDDASRPSARSTFSSVSLSRWSKWLEMGALEGHLLWHAAGRKLESLAELPASYRQRADALQSEHFANPDTTPATARQ